MPRRSSAPVICFLLASVLTVLALLQGGCSIKEKKNDPLIAIAERERYVAPPPEDFSSPAEELPSAYFPTDSAELTDSAKEVLREDARWLKSHPEASIQIEGYCDMRGTHAYNLPLGQKRAEAAKRYLVSQGIAPDRIHALSYGRVEDGNPRRWQSNRRASFIIFYHGETAQR